VLARKRHCRAVSRYEGKYGGNKVLAALPSVMGVGRWRNRPHHRSIIIPDEEEQRRPVSEVLDERVGNLCAVIVRDARGLAFHFFH
jgi:hypothetical protein